jgi:hypothetical protein
VTLRSKYAVRSWPAQNVSEGPCTSSGKYGRYARWRKRSELAARLSLVWSLVSTASPQGCPISVAFVYSIKQRLRRNAACRTDTKMKNSALSRAWRRLSTFVANEPRNAFIGFTVVCLLFLLILSTATAVKFSRPSRHTASPYEYAVINSNFADPCLLNVDGMFYAFATRANPSLHIQVASAKEISDWTLHEGYDAMPSLPKWALQNGDAAVWAPEVVQRVSTVMLCCRVQLGRRRHWSFEASMVSFENILTRSPQSLMGSSCSTFQHHGTRILASTVSAPQSLPT